MNEWSTRWMGKAAAAVDRAVVAAIRAKHRKGGAKDKGSGKGSGGGEKGGASARSGSSRSEATRDLGRLAEAYGAPELFDGAARFFPEPAPIDPVLRRAGLVHGARVRDASWPSAYEPFLPEAAARLRRYAYNDTAHARLYLHDTPRPTVVLLHGYLGGHWRFEEFVWPIPWLFGLGLDVAVAALPFHGLRDEPGRRGAPPFPGVDPRMTNEGFRQAMHDVRGLVRFLGDRGAPAVGVMGMSLGGYTASLLATVEAGLAFVVPLVPLASFTDFLREQGKGPASEERAAYLRALDDATRVTSPFARPSLIASERVLVVAAEADRITPVNHAVRLSHHFAADLVRIPGSHLVQVGVRRGYGAVADRLTRLGLIEDWRRGAHQVPSGGPTTP